MINRARRQLSHLWLRCARRGLLIGCVLLGTQAARAEVVSARYDSPTDRYPHAILGDDLEYGTLVLTLRDGRLRTFTLPVSSVFEDTEPRLVDLDHDGITEILVVESDAQRGARLAVYDAQGRITATPYIGTRFRWLAPVGATDLDGDGLVEVAYVDRPHLAKTLRIWRYEAKTLTEIASMAGVTNHRIGEPDIAGGLRECGRGPEMILADAAWSRLLAIRFEGRDFEIDTIGETTSRAAFARAMICAPL